MNLNNLSMNQKIVIGISSVTILTLIYQYMKNLFYPKNKKILEGQISNNDMTNIIQNRYGQNQNNNNINNLGSSGTDLINENNENILNSLSSNERLLKGLYDELGEFNHIYQERLFESLIPSQIKKTIIHLSSINLSNNDNIFQLASTDNNGLRRFNNVINFKLLGAQLPYVPHNIYTGDGDNNKLIFNSDIITIPEGYYTINTLLNTINTLLSAVSSSITLTFDNISKYITINNPSSVSININITTYPLFNRLGFQNVSSSSNIIGSNIPDLSIHFIDIIYNNNHPRASTLTNDDGNILKRIPLNGQPGDMIYYDVPESDYHSQELFNPDASSNIAEITLEFRRHDRTIYDFKGLHYDIKLEITELIEPTLLNELTSHMRRDRERFFENEGEQQLDIN